MNSIAVTILLGMCESFTFQAQIPPLEYTKIDQEVARELSLKCLDAGYCLDLLIRTSNKEEVYRGECR